jgi:hypothetical protein
MVRFPLSCSIALFLLLSACASPGASPVQTAVLPSATALATQAVPTQLPAPSATPLPAPTDAPASPTAIPTSPLSFDPATYRDESAGFEFDYPAEWGSPISMGSGPRASIMQFSVNGAPQLDVTVQRWDPVNDLESFADQRKQAWEASGFSLLLEEPVILSGGGRGMRFVVQSQSGERGFFFFTPFGDSYLVLSGSGNLDLLAEIALTVRPITASGDAAPGELDCRAPADGSLAWVACNVIDGIRSRNLSALDSFRAETFKFDTWPASQGPIAPQLASATDLMNYLPPDPSLPLTFTVDRGQFPALGGVTPESLVGPDGNIVQVIYSQGWGADGKGAALLYISQDTAGRYAWAGLVVAPSGFE